jgi:ParB family transcriptional regulator, chromosome partitioning protein
MVEKKTRRRKKKQTAEPESRGLTAKQVAAGSPPAEVERLRDTIETDGGTVLAAYRDPLGGNWQLLAALPLDKVEPTPYQRDLSETHVARLADAIEKLGRFLDPVIAVRAADGKYWTPNGYHRLGALRRLGARAIVALVVPEADVAHRILALNTEKAHNLREKALEVVRLAQGLVALDDRPEKEFATEFEEPGLLTLGLCYQENGRFAGGVYNPVVKRIESFLGAKLSKALETRRERARRLLALDAAVGQAVAALKARGFQSPYLKAFVVARINPLRFKRGAKAEFDETIDKMLGAVERFDAAKVRPDQLAAAAGAGAGAGTAEE